MKQLAKFEQSVENKVQNNCTVLMSIFNFDNCPVAR